MSTCDQHEPSTMFPTQCLLACLAILSLSVVLFCLSLLDSILFSSLLFCSVLFYTVVSLLDICQLYSICGWPPIDKAFALNDL